MSTPNREAFERVYAELVDGEDLDWQMLGSIFGEDFWMLLVYSFLDANDAARAIQGAIARLSTRDVPQLDAEVV